MEKISTRQICFILIAYTAAEKLLMYPQISAQTCGRDLLFAAFTDFLIQGAIIWAVAFLCSKTDKTFFGLLSERLGKTAAKIIYWLFAAFFVLCAVVPLFEQKLYVHAIFYDTVPSLIVFLPFFVFAAYAGVKGLKNVGRCADICFPLFVISMLVIFAMSFGEVRAQAFLPILKTPALNIFKSSLFSLYRFFEPAYMLMFIGNFAYKKGDAAKITISYAVGALVVLLVIFVFYGIYADISPTRQFAISKISLYFPATDILGRIDLVVLYVLEVVMLFSLVLKIQLAVHCVNIATGLNKMWLSLAVNVILCALVIVLNHNFYPLLNFFENWMWIAAVIFAMIIPLLSLLFIAGTGRQKQ